MEAAVIEHYKKALPNKPYYTDDFELGLRIAKKNNVLGKKYIQHNQPELAHWIVTVSYTHLDVYKRQIQFLLF